jgi:hypothetical protein
MKHIFATEDDMEALRIVKSLDMALSIFEIGNVRRKYLKYEDLDEKEYLLAEKIFDEINELFINNNVNIDELVE